MAKDHIGEVRNPRIGELPSRTADLPVKELQHHEPTVPEAVIGLISSASRVVRGSDDDESEYETDTDAEEPPEEVASHAQGSTTEGSTTEGEKPEDDSFFGAVSEGLEVVLGPLKTALPATLAAPEQNAYKDIEGDLGTIATEADSGGGNNGLRKRGEPLPKPKKMRKKKKPPKEEPNLDPTRPLDPMEVSCHVHFVKVFKRGATLHLACLDTALKCFSDGGGPSTYG